MRLTLEERKKLIPLRKLAIEGPYEARYLSLLVQRKKLKAKKVGRNYYSTKEWLDEYLELHAQDQKKDQYEQEIERKKQDKKAEQIKEIKKLTKIEQKSEYKIIIFKTVTVSVAVFILFWLANMFIFTVNSPGQVAGISERATSSLGIGNYR